jgi:hypothetical protein
MERTGDRSAWLADKRLAAYVDMLDAFHDARTEMDRIYAVTPGGAPRLNPADEEIVNRVVLRATATYQKVHLLGPEDVAQSANALRWILNPPRSLLLDGDRRNSAKHEGTKAIDLPEFREADLAITGFGNLAMSVVQRRRGWWLGRRLRARRAVLKAAAKGREVSG